MINDVVHLHFCWLVCKSRALVYLRPLYTQMEFDFEASCSFFRFLFVLFDLCSSPNLISDSRTETEAMRSL